MIYIVINALPILAGTAAGVAILAALWRGRMRTAVVVAATVASLVLAAILAGALILAPVEVDLWTISLGSAFIIWGGFVLPSIVATLRSRGTATLAALGDAGAWLAVMLAQAIVMQLIGLARP